MAKINNLAYDYSVYDEEEIQAPRKIKHRVNPAKKKTAGGIKALGAAVAALALFCSMIYGRVELSSLYTQQSEVEEYAENELGLQKLDKSQIEYVEIEGDTVAEVVAPEDTNIFVKIKRWFSDLLEYIGA